MSPTPAEWKCPVCQHEMITSGVDMDTYEQICHERDAMDEQRRELLAALKDAREWVRLAEAGQWHDQRLTFSEAMMGCDAAIAKAEGR